jgi:hypothetical protein
LIGTAFGQAAPSWSLVPKAAETSTGVSYSYSPSATGNAVSTVGRAVSTAANDSFVAAESATLSTPAGQATVSLARGFTGAAARSALADAALAIGRGGLVGAGIAAAAALGPVLEQWMLDQGYHKNSDGSWGVGAAPTPPVTPPNAADGAPYWCAGTSCYTNQSNGDGFSALMSAKGTIHTTIYNSFNCGTTDPYVWSGSLVSQCVRFQTWPSGAGDWVYVEVISYRHGAGQNSCSDGSAPVAGSCPPDGTGPTGPPSLSPSDVHAAAAAAPNPAITDWSGAFDNAATLGYAPDMGYTPTVTGPDTITGTSTVTSTKTITQPDGSTQTLTETSQEVSHLTYNGSQVAIDTHVVTSTQNPDGSTTKTDKPAATAPDICAGFPNLLGCTNLGTPETTTVPTSTKSIAYTAEDVSLPSGCPAPVSLGRFGELSFQSACDNANTMRPFILAVAGFVSLGICVAAVSGVRGS